MLYMTRACLYHFLWKAVLPSSRLCLAWSRSFAFNTGFTTKWSTLLREHKEKIKAFLLMVDH